MINYKLFINNKDVTDKFAQTSKIYGILFIILGMLGMFFPGIMSLTSAVFVGWLLLFSGIFTAVQTWQVNKKDWLGWLKSLLFIVVSILIVLDPLSGVVALAIIFTAYFFVDSVLNLILALQLRPNSGWWIVLLNAILSFAIGVYFFISLSNPIKTIWLVGMFVGISLFFDGVMLLTLASAAKEEEKKQ
jgi:uncharacterized membrane protein HdeD (DUF308 family)